MVQSQFKTIAPPEKTAFFSDAKSSSMSRMNAARDQTLTLQIRMGQRLKAHADAKYLLMRTGGAGSRDHLVCRHKRLKFGRWEPQTSALWPWPDLFYPSPLPLLLAIRGSSIISIQATMGKLENRTCVLPSLIFLSRVYAAPPCVPAYTGLQHGHDIYKSAQ